jgi:hypothetical protein
LPDSIFSVAALRADTGRGSAGRCGTGDSPGSAGGARNSGAGYRRDGSDDGPTNEGARKSGLRARA